MRVFLMFGTVFFVAKKKYDTFKVANIHETTDVMTESTLQISSHVFIGNMLGIVYEMFSLLTDRPLFLCQNNGVALYN